MRGPSRYCSPFDKLRSYNRLESELELTDSGVVGRSEADLRLRLCTPVQGARTDPEVEVERPVQHDLVDLNKTGYPLEPQRKRLAEVLHKNEELVLIGVVRTSIDHIAEHYVSTNIDAPVVIELGKPFNDVCRQVPQETVAVENHSSCNFHFRFPSRPGRPLSRPTPCPKPLRCPKVHQMGGLGHSNRPPRDRPSRKQ